MRRQKRYASFDLKLLLSISHSFRYISQLENEMSKMTLLQTESEKSKQNVELKQLDLVVWKKRYDNFVAENVCEFSK